uniref:Peptidase A2 domain-containing protein n=1 Tax=Ascaris suum TaxID=6253 RepID=F1KU04_ASCSU
MAGNHGSSAAINIEAVRAIIEAQEERQQRTLSAILELADRQQQALLERVERMLTAIKPAPPASTAEFITSSLSTRLPEFAYDPDNGGTFDVWFNRYEDIISKDGAALDDAARARLIVSKLDATTYARFTNHILPKRASELSLEDTVKTLKELFGHNTSIFARRYVYLRTQRNGESLNDYTGIVNQRHEMAEFNTITPEQMKCLVWICGLHSSEDADIRTRALRKMEDNPQATLKELTTEIQQFLSIRQDTKLLNSPSASLLPEINTVNTRKNCMPNPPSPCFRCGRLHWAKDCDFINKTCHDCKLIGHKKGFCKNFTKKKKKKQNSRKERRAANYVTVITSNAADIAPINRIYRQVQINGITVQMRLDTGADVTLLSVRDWIAINRPKLLPPLVKLKSANNKNIKVRGYFECDFDINGHKGRGYCHVADTQSLLGIDWISQNEPLFRSLTEGVICNVSATTLNRLRSTLIARLQKQFPTVFTPGLGRCTKSKAHLTLKPDARPIFRKSRPVPYAAQLRDTKMEEQFNRHHGARRRHFKVGDAVYAKDYRGPKSTWIPGIVVRKVGNATYSVRCGNLLWTRHINQLRSRKKTPPLGQLLDVFDLPLFNSDTSTANPVSDSSTPIICLRRSTRTRRAPKRLHMDPTKATYRS